MYKPTVTGPLGTSLPWHFPCRNEKRQTMSGFFYGRRRTDVAKERQGLVGWRGGGGGDWRNCGGRRIQSTLSARTISFICMTITNYYSIAKAT